MATYYKLARPDGWDFYTGRTINYREMIGTMVRPPNANPWAQPCSPGILHASLRAEDCFQGASIPCSLYEIEGTPVCHDDSKAGFIEMRVLREIDPAAHFKWRYVQAVNPLNPLAASLLRPAPTEYDLTLLRRWASVWAIVGDNVPPVGLKRAVVGDRVENRVENSARASVEDSVGANVWTIVRDSVWASVRASVGDSVRDSVWASVRASVGASVGVSVWTSVWTSVWASVRDSVWAYVGWIFAPIVTNWKYISHRKGQYPFMSVVRLWQRGLIPSYNGTIWRLHSGTKAQVVWP